jgi:hypothetical protein
MGDRPEDMLEETRIGHSVIAISDAVETHPGGHRGGQHEYLGRGWSVGPLHLNINRISSYRLKDGVTPNLV